MERAQIQLHLLKPDGEGNFTAESLAAFYEKLTGKKPTPEELEATRKLLKQQKRRSEKQDQASSLAPGAAEKKAEPPIKPSSTRIVNETEKLLGTGFVIVGASHTRSAKD